MDLTPLKGDECAKDLLCLLDLVEQADASLVILVTYLLDGALDKAGEEGVANELSQGDLLIDFEVKSDLAGAFNKHLNEVVLSDVLHHRRHFQLFRCKHVYEYEGLCQVVLLVA